MTLEELLARAQLIRQNLAALDEIPQGSLDEFEADARNLQATLHLIQTSIQALIDMGTFHCARLGLPTPQSSRDAFQTLEADGQIPPGTTDTVTPMVGFRNRIVHLYDKVDSKRVYEVLRSYRGDLEQLVRLMLSIDDSGDDH